MNPIKYLLVHINNKLDNMNALFKNGHSRLSLPRGLCRVQQAADADLSVCSKRCSLQFVAGEVVSRLVRPTH